MSILNISELTILLVEPSATQLKVIIKHLEQEGITAIEGVTTGADALKSIKAYAPDLVISSMYLPDMTATDLVISIRESGAEQGIPFMLISSETDFKALDPIRQAGVVAILPKPFSPSDLKRALKSSVEFITPEEVCLEHYDIALLKVLVVDDSLMARKHITRVLNNMGIIDITTANDGKQGVDIFSAHQNEFDLIVTDYNMPVMDGQELIHFIRHDMQNTFIPILMVTSEENEMRLNNVQQSGVSAICDKPFEPQTVKEMLYRVME
ncbi:MAG: two-component system, chemotaxis family, chemotaxis protein CheY [Methyloprofundus sp.]|nr:MAG: two-component system, chemotaxis family, chemotaxis protein CheY [Methyloprofundus sp.]